MIDLRSDTVTKPTHGMLKAMHKAEVGDDVLGEDPCINKLEAYAAERFGMEAAIFCPSGTMTNQIAIRLHTNPGGEVICDHKAHIYQYECGGIAVNAQCSVALMQGDRGRFDADAVQKAIRPNDIHQPPTQLVAIENTVNKGGGACYDFKELERIKAVCEHSQLAFHLDGARLFNAMIARDESPKQYGALFDSISICLSKGLGAPVGSLLLGQHGAIQHARRLRKLFGGGMRQAGYLAAAGLYALEHHVERLHEDHKRARVLAHALAENHHIESVLEPETNIVVATLKPEYQPELFLQELADNGVLAIHFGGQQIRFVTHLDFNDQQLAQVLKALP